MSIILKTTLAIGLGLVVFSSCKNADEFDRTNLNILVETNADIRKHNVALLHRAKQIINERGERPADLDLLNDILKTLNIRKSNDLYFDFKKLESNDEMPNIDVSSEKLMHFVTEYSKRHELLGNGQDKVRKIDKLEHMIQQYIENRSLLNLILLDLQMLKLERDLLETLILSLGDTESLSFNNRISVFPQSEFPRTGKLFTAILMINRDMVGSKINLSKPAILINGKTSIAYELKSYNTGLWQLAFRPERSGTYIIEFNTYFTSEIYPSEKFTFSGRFEVEVE